jgi:hypothetical protein
MMSAVVSWWDLDGSGHSLTSLRGDLDDETVRRWARVPGLRWKVWISDEPTNRWGAVMLWDDGRPGQLVLPANRALELIGRPPVERTAFRVEAAAWGQSYTDA